MSIALQDEIRHLSVAEKILLVEDIWDQIAKETDLEPLPVSQRVELDRRYQEFLRDPQEGSSWTEVKSRILG